VRGRGERAGRPTKESSIMIRASFVLLLAVLASAPAHAAEKPARRPRVRPEQVERMIRTAVDYLYSVRDARGTWEIDQTAAPQQSGGTTALAVYALLAAGESPSNDKLRPAIEWLKKAKMDGTYAIAMRLNAMAMLPPASVKDVMQVDRDYLIRAQTPALNPQTKQPARGAGLYGYDERINYDAVDHSVSQYGVLGMWVLEDAGMPAPAGYWDLVQQAWVHNQLPDGGWSYGGTTAAEGPPTGSMTAAGLATLFISQDHLRDPRRNVDDNIDRGVAWLAKHFDAETNPGSGVHDLYWLYGVERVGVAGGLRYFGEHGWFPEGTRALAKKRQANGSYGIELKSERTVQDTSFALLFLARGQRPVLMSKLRYEGKWNSRPRDVSNLVRWYGRRYESELHWQVVTFAYADEDLQDSPILYVSGGEALKFSAEEVQLLRRYVDGGGLILGIAERESPAFAQTFQMLAEELYPGTSMRPLPPEHPVMAGSAAFKKPIPVLGLSNGLRERMLLLPQGDPGRWWQTMTEKAQPDAFRLIENIVFYATDKARLRVRNQSHYVTPDESVVPERKAKLARIRHPGRWDPEPGGWRRLAALVHNENRLSLAVEEVTLGEGKLPEYQFAHVTGMEAVEFSPEQIKEVRSFLVRGGTLLIDAANGSKPFADALEQQMGQLMPGARWAPVALNDPILADTMPRQPPAIPLGGDAPPAAADDAKPAKPTPLHIEYRRHAKLHRSDAEGLQLRGLQVGRRWGVLLTPFDLSQGLVGANVDGVTGYSPATATELTRRLVVNATGAAAGR
jgi:hypothetical protein